MKGKQIAMTEALADLDRYELERERRETDAIKERLDEQYGRIDYRKLQNREYPAGSVVIIGQELFREGHYKLHFYRTILNYFRSASDPNREVFVEATNEDFPERPPWADTVGHEGERKDIDWIRGHIHWATGEIVEPIKTWWMERWGD